MFFQTWFADRIWWIDRFRSYSDVTDIWGSPVFQSPFVYTGCRWYMWTSRKIAFLFNCSSVFSDIPKHFESATKRLAIRCLAKSQRWLWDDAIPEGPTSLVFFHVGSGSLKLVKIFDKTAETSTGNWKIFHLIFNLATRNSSNLQLFCLCPAVYLSSTQLNGAVETPSFATLQSKWWKNTSFFLEVEMSHFFNV